MTIFPALELLNDSNLLWLLSLLFESALILTVVTVILALIRSRISSTTAHLVWLGALLCVAVLPIAELLSGSGVTTWNPIANITVFTVSPQPETMTASGSETLASFLLVIYSLVAAVLLLQLARSAWQLRRLDISSEFPEDDSLHSQFALVCDKLRLGRKVTLKTSQQLQSPVSYGFLAPTVLVPTAISQWPQSLREDVFIHELSHIKRRDWLVLIFSRILSSLLWLNPLLWFATKKLHDEAEQACDSAIVNLGKDRVGYAEGLLNLAKAQRAADPGPLLAQPMYDHHDLTQRIQNILEGKISTGVSATALFTLCSVVLFTAVTGSGLQLIAAEEDLADQEYLPIRTSIPQYPTRAAERGIEGWILLSFTVMDDGKVDPASIEVLDAEPVAEIFQNSASNALVGFEFQARVIDGSAVEVPGVQYLFVYDLNEEAGFEDGSIRPPPSARSR